MVEFGPIELIVMGFPSLDQLKGELLREIFKLRVARTIRVVGLQAIAKDKKGKTKTVEISELHEKERIKLGAGIGALIGFGEAGGAGALAGAEAGAEMAAQTKYALSSTQIKAIAEEMPNDTAAVFLLVEHLWAKKLEEIALAHDGAVLATSFISPDALVAIGALLAEGAEAAEKLQAQ
jgi:uncharacterized membrane protein